MWEGGSISAAPPDRQAMWQALMHERTSKYIRRHYVTHKCPVEVCFDEMHEMVPQ
jgi:hypothetical protein